LKTRNWQQALKEIREKQFEPDNDTLGFRDAANRFLGACPRISVCSAKFA
jgi:hypothetical protein